MKRRAFLAGLTAALTAAWEWPAKAGFAIFQVNGPGGGGGGGPMAGVTVQAIDGGATFYGSSGLTFPASFPANLPQPGGGGVATPSGWDSSTFFPLGTFLADYGTTAKVDVFIGNYETMASCTLAGVSVTNNTYARTNNMSMIFFGNDFPQGPIGAETVGMIGADEPSGYFAGQGGDPAGKSVYRYVNSIVPNTDPGGTYNAFQNGKFWYLQCTVAQVVFDNFGMADTPSNGGHRYVLGTPILTPGGVTSRKPADVFSWDLYWELCGRADPPLNDIPQGPMRLPGTPTVDQICRGSWYGDMLDYNRRIMHDASLDIPLLQIIGVLGGNSGAHVNNTINSLLSSQEQLWDTWSAIIHGCRGITWFPLMTGTNPAAFEAGLNGQINGHTYDTVPRTCSITSGTIANGSNVLTVNSVGAGTFDNIPFNSLLTGAGIPTFTYIIAQLTSTGVFATGGGGTGTYLLNKTISPGVTAIAMTATSGSMSYDGNTGAHNLEEGKINRLVRSFAPIINSSFAINYAWVSPAGYLFPHATVQCPAIGTNAIDIMTKYYTGSTFTDTFTGNTFDTGKFYIFAATRGSQQQTNISATFHIADFGATSVTVLSDSSIAQRTISISTPGQFTDTFEVAWAVRCYKVNGPKTPASAPTTKTIFLTSGTTWTVPPDWNPANANSFELIGGGGSGANAGTGWFRPGPGGGGGEYCKITNQGSTHFQAGDVITGLVIGARGTHPAAGNDGNPGTATVLKDRTGATLATANPGLGGLLTPKTGGAGGTGSSASVHFNGGAGGDATVGGCFGGAGGGGAGGPNGVGGAGASSTGGALTGGVGGGGNGGGAAGITNSGTANTIGCQGGMNVQGYGGGAGSSPRIAGDTGFWGGGGGGGGGGVTFAGIVCGTGGTGGTGNEWISTLGIVGGSGGGGGGGGNSNDTSGIPGDGGSGGLYGGGGAGSSYNNNNVYSTAGDGAPGIIVITYQP